MAVSLYSSALIAVAIAGAGIAGTKLRLSSAIIEVAVGIFLGNFLQVKIEPWLDFLGTYGGLILTFLAGAEIEIILLKKTAKPSFVIGTMAFVAPLIGEVLFLSFFTTWSLISKLAVSLALTTTSVAVVYAVLTEYEILKLPASRIIIAVTFVNDILTLIGINVISPSFDVFTVMFFAVLALMIFAVPRLLRFVVVNYGKKAVEIELRVIFAAMLGVAFIADVGRLHAVFGAFVLGLVFANSVQKYEGILPKIRTVTFSILSPAFFVKAGLLISLPSVVQNIVLIVGLLGTKLLSKFVGTFNLNKKWIPEAPVFSTMLFSTGLTIGTITATLGRDLGLLNQTQFSVTVVTVILSAIIPSIIAKRFVPKKI
jgi:Kef-type K+ transport system membrane component KefB